MGRYLFRIENLSFSYNGTPVFKDFYARSNAKIVVLLGPSGCGKTTLLKLLSGHLKPDRITYMPPSEGSCIIIQEDGLFPWLTGIQNLMLGKSISMDTIYRHPLYFLIKDFVKKKVYTLSFGQRRKIELIRTLTHRFQLLCLDEPFNFIDPDSRKIFADYINSKISPKTLLAITSHYENDFKDVDCDIFSLDGKLPVQGIQIPIMQKATDILCLNNKNDENGIQAPEK
jgi:ABC-type multidrug transport system ATPase subunit